MEHSPVVLMRGSPTAGPMWGAVRHGAHEHSAGLRRALRPQCGTTQRPNCIQQTPSLTDLRAGGIRQGSASLGALWCPDAPAELLQPPGSTQPPPATCGAPHFQVLHLPAPGPRSPQQAPATAPLQLFSC